MAKQSGLGMQAWIDGYRVGGDIQNIDRIAGPCETLDFTDITKRAFERQIGRRDGAIDLSAFFNPDGLATPPGIHSVLKGLPLTDRIVSAAIPLPGASLAIGDPVAFIVAKQGNYDGNREQSGAFTFKVATQANAYGLEWCTLATAGERADTTATNGSGLNLGTMPSATVSFGLQAYLQVISFSGTSCTVKLQGSSDNGAGDAFADITGGAFAAVTTAPQAQRIATASNAAIEQYIRVVTTGTFSSCVFVVGVNRNTVATTF